MKVSAPSVESYPADKKIVQGILWDGRSGASSRAWNEGMELGWVNRGGDWLDKDGVPQGKAPYSTLSFSAGEVLTQGDFDITPLAKKWLSGVNTGLFLRIRGGTVVVQSREAENAAQRPLLRVQT